MYVIMSQLLTRGDTGSESLDGPFDLWCIRPHPQCLMVQHEGFHLVTFIRHVCGFLAQHLPGNSEVAEKSKK